MSGKTDTILVTGAAGFIGSHTCDQLLASGFHVVGIDDFSTGRRENLAKATQFDRFTLIKSDVTDAAGLKRIVGEIRPAAIIHLAALVSVEQSIENPDLNFRLNIESTHHLAEAARQFRGLRFVFASSAAVYGDNPAACTPVSPYGAAKLASENLLFGYARTYGLTVRCQRYFNVFGPRQDPRSPYSGVITRFVTAFRQQQAPTIYGDGRQTRDFISVHDIARANLLAATAPNLPSGVADICTGRATSVVELARRLQAHYAGAPSPVFAPNRPGDIRHSQGSPAAAAALGFQAEISLEAGLIELAREASPPRLDS